MSLRVPVPSRSLSLATMARISRDQAVSALVEAVREALVRGEDVHVPDLGTFHVQHHPSIAEELPTGEVVMRPPRNVIVFAPQE